MMNNSNNRSNHGSEISQDMLMLNGELNSGMEKENSSFYHHHKNSGQEYRPNNQNRNQPSQAQKYQQPAYTRQSYNRYSNPVLENLEPVNDEMRKRPFTIPVVKV